MKLESLIQQGEGLRIEFKSAKNALPQNLFETVCAFLNKQGGEIVLGLSDDGTIEGIDPVKAELMLQTNYKKYRKFTL